MTREEILTTELLLLSRQLKGLVTGSLLLFHREGDTLLIVDRPEPCVKRVFSDDKVHWSFTAWSGSLEKSDKYVISSRDIDLFSVIV